MHPETAAALDIVARRLERLGAEIFSGAEDSVTGKWPHPDDVTAKDFDTPAEIFRCREEGGGGGHGAERYQDSTAGPVALWHTFTSEESSGLRLAGSTEKSAGVGSRKLRMISPAGEFPEPSKAFVRVSEKQIQRPLDDRSICNRVRDYLARSVSGNPTQQSRASGLRSATVVASVPAAGLQGMPKYGAV